MEKKIKFIYWKISQPCKWYVLACVSVDALFTMFVRACVSVYDYVLRVCAHVRISSYVIYL